MTVDDDDAVYTLQSIQEMLGISRNVVLGMIKAGFVSPMRGPRNTYRFGFQDVVLLRTAQSLRSARIPARRIHRSLERLRALLPSSVPLTGLRITAVGDDIAVREAGQDVALESGQLLMDFDVAPGPGDVLSFPSRGVAVDEAEDWVTRAQALEARDPEAAIDAYRSAIASDPADVRASLGLGALLHESHALGEALATYDLAVTRMDSLGSSADDSQLRAQLHYNRAIVLEDLKRIDEALVSYERCLALAADFADAHWNVARLYEQRGGAQQALQHFNAYRRLQRSR